MSSGGSNRGGRGWAVAASRRVYQALMRAYPKDIRDRYGEEMVGCFADACRDEVRQSGAKGLAAVWLRTLPDLILTALKERSTMLTTNTYRSVIGVALATVFILLVPLLANWPWTLSDFVFAGTLVFGTGLAFVLVARKAGNIAYRAAVGVALAAAFFLVWVNAAVGIIGDPGDHANSMYVGVLAVALSGAIVARFEPAGMARAITVTAVAQALVAATALIAGLGATEPPGSLGILILNGFFVVLFTGSALLFRYAARGQTLAGAEPES